MKGNRKEGGFFKEIWRRINFRWQAVEGWSSHMLQGENLFKDKSEAGRQKVDRGKDGKKLHRVPKAKCKELFTALRKEIQSWKEDEKKCTC